MWCHSCICLEGQRKFTEDICEDKLSLIPNLNSGSSCCESLVPRLGRNFLFTLDLFGFCTMLLITWYLSLGKCLSCHGPPYCSQATIPGNLVLIASVGLLPSAFAVLCYMLDAELFPQRQLISHGEHFVSIMKTLSSFSLCVLLTEYAICLSYHKYRQWGVIHSVTQEGCT